MRIARKISSFSLASFMLSLVSIIPGVSYLAILLGILGLVQTGKRGTLRGRLLAIGGTMNSLIIPALVVILLPVLSTSNEKARQSTCMSNQRQIALAINMYCTENEEILPGNPTDTKLWREDIGEEHGFVISPKVCDCPSSGLSGAPGPETAEYAMNADIMGVGLGLIPVPVSTLLTADTIGTDAIFDSSAIDPRHNGGFIASFVDGHVELIRSDNLPRDPGNIGVGPEATEDTFSAAGIPSVNSYLIQGATNVIGINGDGDSYCSSGKKLFSSFGSNSEAYITVHIRYDLLNKKEITLTNGSSANYAGNPPPAATSEPFTISGKIIIPEGTKAGVYTFMLPPAIGRNSADAPLNNGYIMSGKDGKVTISASVLE